MTTNALAQTLPELVQQAVDAYGDQTALKETDNGQIVELSYNKLNDMRWQAARALLSMSISKGDVVAIWAPNVSQWIVASLAAQSLGAVVVPINTRMKGSEAADLINRSKAKVLFSVAEFESAPGSFIRYFDMLADFAMPSLMHKVSMRGQSNQTLNWQEFMDCASAVEQDAVETIAASILPTDSMDMLFTSGTTGKAKGVICAHGQNIRTVATWADINGLNSNDNYLIINPFFHSFGYKAGWLAALIKGAKILPVLSFDLNAVLQQIEDDQVSMLPGPPPIYQSILAHPERARFDLSSLRLAVTGAAPVPVELVNRMRSELKFESVVTAYGLTETCGFVSICRPDDPAEIISASSGRAMEGIEVKCVDGEGDEVVRGEPGEIWVRGYNVMQGYFDDPQATADAITSDGWLKTGDVGVMDKAGYIDITDRMKDMYISGGFNVYPAEVENAIASITGVVQVAVIGVADERMGEVGKAFIVADDEAGLTEHAVRAWCKENIANYKVPKVVEFIAAMPLNATGKILKTSLRQA